MKFLKYLIIIVLLPVCTTLFSQNKFEYLYPSQSFKLPADIIETIDHNYIFCSASYDSSFSREFFSIIKINESGELIKIKEFTELEDVNIINLVVNSDSTFLCLGNYYNVPGSNRFVVFCTNNDLEILWRKEYNSNGRIYDYIRRNHNSSGNIVFSARSDSLIDAATYLYDPGMILYELNNNGDSIIAKQFSERNQEPYQIIEKPDHTGYYLFGYTILIDTIFRKNYITELDHEFNPVEENEGPFEMRMTFFTNARNLGTSKIIYTGYDNLPGEQYVGAVAILDSSLNLIAKQQIIVPDTIVNLSHQYNLDFRDNNNIYVSGFSNFLNIPIQYEPSWVIITNMDSMLNKRWEKFYGGDAFYFPWSTLATSDGGCIVLGYRWDWNVHYYDNEIFVLKVDSLGHLTTIYGPEILAEEINVFPNPGTDILNLSLAPNIKPSRFELYDLTGKLILVENMATQFITINTSFINPGLYFYKIYNKNKQLYSGKWVKK